MIFKSKDFPFDNKVKPVCLIEWTKSSNADAKICHTKDLLNCIT